MKKYIIVMVTTLLLLSYFLWTKEIVSKDTVTTKQANAQIGKLNQIKLIAHAGGGVEGLTYTNSLEAFNQSYKKRFFLLEADIETTSDNKFVVLHDWRDTQKLFNVKPMQYSLREFKSFKMVNGLTQLTLDDLLKWIKKHPDATLVLDIKRDIFNLNSFEEAPIKILRKIKDKHVELQSRIIPQIFRFEEYEKVKNLGYQDIILTLGAYPYTNEQVFRFLKNHPVFFVSMDESRARSELPKRLKSLGISTFAYTINDMQLVKKYMENGVTGFYTDFLSP